MRRMALVSLAAMLAACNQQEAHDVGATLKSPGRYSGIGTFEPGRLWQQLAGAPASPDPQAANLVDDEHIIVVLDSHTGEVRQCGNHSGVCVAMSPWSGETPLHVPSKLVKHAAELDAEAEAEAANNQSAAAR